MISLKSFLETILRKDLKGVGLARGLFLVRTDTLSRIIMLLSGLRILK